MARDILSSSFRRLAKYMLLASFCFAFFLNVLMNDNPYEGFDSQFFGAIGATISLFVMSGALPLIIYWMGRRKADTSVATLLKIVWPAIFVLICYFVYSGQQFVAEYGRP